MAAACLRRGPGRPSESIIISVVVLGRGVSMKVIAFSSSPRKGSNSDALADTILAAAKEAGAEVEKVMLAELHIGGCRACDACKKGKELKCAQEDDMVPLLEKVMEADAYVLASPIYFFSANSQMKAFLDRCYALMKPGLFDKMKGRKLAVALSYGDKNPYSSGGINAIRMFQDICNFLGMEFVGSVSASCSDAGEVLKKKDIIKEAEGIGRGLVTEG